MSDDPENLVLVYLRRIDANVQELRSDVRDLRNRTTRIESELGKLLRDRGEDFEGRAHLQAQVDRLREELERVKRRLDIID